MIINKIISGTDPCDIAAGIQERIHSSRFTADVDAKRSHVKIINVRLRTKKLYCGNHPKACERLFHGRHMRLDYLEGADWVELNDAINDVLDRMDVDCSVTSTVCILRKGRRRRVFYDANFQATDGNWAWDKDGPDGHYSDNCGGRTPFTPSEFPFGTPGVHEGADYACVGAHH